MKMNESIIKILAGEFLLMNLSIHQAVGLK